MLLNFCGDQALKLKRILDLVLLFRCPIQRISVLRDRFNDPLDLPASFKSHLRRLDLLLRHALPEIVN